MNVNSQQGRRQASDFKIPETPAKNSIKSLALNVSSNQFNSTPKTLSRQSSKINQSLSFEDISPIKAVESCFVNLKQESKRQLEESVNHDNSSKKRKVLFGQKPKVNDDLMMEDDSFDQFLSQIDDKVLIGAKSSSNVKPVNHLKNQQPQRVTNNSQSIRSTTNQQANKQWIQYSQPVNKTMKNTNRNSIYSNTPSTFRSGLSSNMQITQVSSSIQFSDDSSLSVKERKSLSNNLKPNFSQQTSNNQIRPANRPNSQNNQINRIKCEVKSQPEDDLMMDDEDADFICSQIPG